MFFFHSFFRNKIPIILADSHYPLDTRVHSFLLYNMRCSINRIGETLYYTRDQYLTGCFEISHSVLIVSMSHRRCARNGDLGA